MRIFRKENIMPLIGLGLTLFGLVMLIIAGDWTNVVWPVIVLFLIFKGFAKTDKYFTLLSDHENLIRKYRELDVKAGEIRGELDTLKAVNKEKQ